MLRDYTSVAAICSRENVSFEGFLLRLCERELTERRQRAMERRIKTASFPTLKTIESFQFNAQPEINEPLIRELLVGEFIGQRENVLLIVNSGTGKTHLAACHEERRVQFFGVTALVTQLLEAREDRQLEKLMKQLSRFDLLILDELGYVPFTKAGAELLFEVVSRAYETAEYNRYDKLALRAVGGGLRLPAADRCHAGPPDASGAHHRGQR
jgi:DNA replication protein DnaC